jgi:predicted phosphohydrolase
MKKISLFIAASLLAAVLWAVKAPSASATRGAADSTFTFVALGDSHGDGTSGDQTKNFTTTISQVASLHPDFIIHHGDLEDDGVVTSQLSPMVTILKNAGLFNQTFIVRGNHDDHDSGSAKLWNSYFSSSSNLRTLPAGVANYKALDSSSTYLTYSFDYGNARFIGVDVTQDVNSITSAQYTFIDQRLTEAESLGLIHAFIFFHIAEYCVESTHCSCTQKNNSACTPASFTSLINKHPIVSATFHGHEHIMAWVHMDSSRVSGLTHPYEEFFTSPSGGYYYTYNPGTLYTARVDYAYTNMGSSQGFAVISVNCTAFTVNLYKDGTAAPFWSKTFSKGPCPTPTPTPTFTPSDTLTPTLTPSTTETPTLTPSETLTATLTPSSTETPTLTPSTTEMPTLIPSETLTATPTPSESLTPVPGPVSNYLYLPLAFRGISP